MNYITFRLYILHIIYYISNYPQNAIKKEIMKPV